MKKLFTSSLVIASMVLAPALKASDVTTETEATPENEGTPVGQGANEGVKAAKRRQWQNIALAIGAVAVAVTAMILVANNDGHKSHKHKK